MSAHITVAAVDLGAESGRVASVRFDGERLSLEVINRFAHQPRRVDGVLRWDMDTLWGGIHGGLGQLGSHAPSVASVGVDAWGVDYGLIDGDGALVDDPTCYRDPRQSEQYDQAIKTIGPERIYDATGVQIMPINTLFAVMSDSATMPQRLEGNKTLLMLPDVFHHSLCGTRVTEYTAASTTGFYDMARNTWATALLDELGVPTTMLPEVVQPGTDVGALSGDLAVGGLKDARVIVPPSHDTASAVVGTPLADPDGLYISSGTWSLVGVETPGPVISRETQRRNITNEGGYARTIRLLRNVAGLWLLQSCRRAWEAEGHAYSYPELVVLASEAGERHSIVNPDAPEFLDGQGTPRRIQEYCAATGSAVPETPGEIVRCALESLALSYRAVLDDLAETTARPIPTINIVGGGSNNTLLSQLTADATGLTVRCGPVEATALGNAAAQLVALGELSGLDDIRRIVAATTEMTTYSPTPNDGLDEAYEAFRRLRERDTANTTRDHQEGASA